MERGKPRVGLLLALALTLLACAGLPAAEPALTPTTVSTEETTPELAGAAGGQARAAAEGPTATAAPTQTPQPTPRVVELKQPYDPVSMEVLERINDWRVSLGLWPLKVNDTLTQEAQAQADYLAGLADFPDDPHAGPTGKHPKERAADLGWPSYNTPDQIAVDEVAYTGLNPATAMTWWQESPIHAKTLSQTAYREIGVAVADHGHGRVYVGVLGSRPGVLPVLLDPASSTWYISSEQYRWAAGDRIQQVTRFAFLPDAAGQVSDSSWLPYALTSAAGNLGDAAAVALSDNKHTVIQPVALAVDIAWLTSDASQVSITIQPGSLAAAVVDAIASQPTAAPTDQPTPTQTPPPAPAQAGASDPNLTIIYGPVSLAIWHNPPGKRIDISGVVLKAADAQIRTTDFDGPWLGVPLNDFSVGSCLQTWPMSADQGDPGAPAGCYVRAAIVNLKTSSKFWLKEGFDVLNNGAVVGQCPVGPATCGVTLP